MLAAARATSILPLLCFLVSAPALALPEPQNDIPTIFANAAAGKGPKCSPVYNDFPGFNLTLAAERDLVPLGPYDAINCGYHIVDLRYGLGSMQRWANLVVEDAAFGVNSDFGFRSFFKSNNSINAVSSIFRQIAEGAVLPDNECYPNARPAVFCVNSNDVVPRKLRDVCVADRTAFFNLDYPHVVMICPRIWGLPDLRERNVRCPRVGRRGKLTPNNDVIAQNPQALLVHELVHVYKGTRQRSVEKYQIQDAVDLNEADSLWNAASYALYFACESSAFSCACCLPLFWLLEWMHTKGCREAIF